MPHIYGIAIFDVNKDLDVVLFELENLGLRLIEIHDKYIQYFIRVREEFGKYIGECKFHKDYAFRYRMGKLVLVRLCLDEYNRVTRVIMVSLSPSTLKYICKKVEKFGWRRELMFEIRRLVRKAKSTD